MADQRKSIHALTGLRFFAALLVFSQHLPWQHSLKNFPVPFGAIGVSFFFVLSGFILTFAYHERLCNWKDIRLFYFARVARIWPVHLVCLLLCTFLILNAGDVFAAKDGWPKFLMNFLLIQSWIPDLDWAMGFNHVSWSISTEFFFYALFPLLLLMKSKWFWQGFVGLGLITMCLLAASIGLTRESYAQSESWITMKSVYAFVLVSPVARVWEFMAGIAVGKIYLRRQPDAIPLRRSVNDSLVELTGLCAMVIYIILLNHGCRWCNANPQLAFVTNWLIYSGCTFVFAPIVYLFATRRGIVSQLLSTRLMVYLGEISFSFYMIHQLVIRFMTQYVADFNSFGFWFCVITTFSISLALSAILFGLVEMPLKNGLLSLYHRNWKQALVGTVTAWKSKSKSPVIIGATLSIAAACVLINLEQRQKYDRRFDDKQIDAVIAQSTAGQFPIQFENELILHGATVTRTQDNGLLVRLIWQKQTESSRHRFIHVVGDGEKILCNPVISADQQDFKCMPVNRRWLEECTLQKQQLVGGFKIGIGLYSKEAGAAKIDIGSTAVPVSMGGGRLDIAFLETADRHDSASSPRPQRAGVIR